MRTTVRVIAFVIAMFVTQGYADEQDATEKFCNEADDLCASETVLPEEKLFTVLNYESRESLQKMLDKLERTGGGSDRLVAWLREQTRKSYDPSVRFVRNPP